ncbi:hypothetical protein DFH08DRAFT_941545 [Mycena albidolilacea]|uniref:Uncharacterized protein n=1 Tax=Mycena albidolilacea TaxID=1033008 RepID=A0AAD7EGQ2_9AGAR|nr:hypothetical protein DFH08DRAFT_941545 [Mycena albidolilacea]
MKAKVCFEVAPPLLEIWSRVWTRIQRVYAWQTGAQNNALHVSRSAFVGPAKRASSSRCRKMISQSFMGNARRPSKLGGLSSPGGNLLLVGEDSRNQRRSVWTEEKSIFIIVFFLNQLYFPLTEYGTLGTPLVQTPPSSCPKVTWGRHHSGKSASNRWSHVSPGESADGYAPISELVYHLNGASLSPMGQNTDGDNGWDRWHVLSGREYRRVLELELDDDDDSSIDEGDYEKPEESGRKRKPEPPRGAPKKTKKTATQKKPAVASKKPTAAQKPTALQEARKAALKSARAAGGA